MFPSVSPARMVRLCLKELRESLRDRRTIVTLVLMPLLVYPLLSLVLNRVLLTSSARSAETTVSIGIGQELKHSPLPVLLEIGIGLLHERETAPVFLERVVQEKRQPGTGLPTLPSSALPHPKWMLLDDSGRDALRDGAVDVVLTRKTRVEDDDGNPLTSNARTLLQPIIDNIRAVNDIPDDVDLNGLLDVVGTYEVRYRERDPQSERALQVVERILAAVNNEAARQALDGRFDTPFQLSATPVVMKSNYADLLATMVPLVLVLMTMAGAVYPAIDLTAGERERGTMEALIVSPTPTGALLFAKYTAVVTVALLTALANLAAMTITLWVSGIGKLVFGDGVLSAGVIGTVLVLLVLFTMFFAALLLAVTSFAKSFKEAQAYLIPLMLLALTPGVMSLLPGIKFTGLLATVPLVNIVLLAREVLMSAAEWNTALVAVICNSIYAVAALAVASRLFGSDASMQGSQGSWRDLIMRPLQNKRFPSVDQMALTMSAMFPMYFIASSSLPATSNDLLTRLWISAAVSFLLIMGVPVFVAWYRRLTFSTTFRLGIGNWKAWPMWLPGIVLVGSSAWMFAHEIFIAGQAMGIGTINEEHFERVADFRDDLRNLPLWAILFVFAITPAICEEFLFRGFVLSSLHRYSATWAVCLSAILFGLMHVLTSNMLAIERFFPTTFMGLLLGWIAIRTGSLWPGVFLHALHNGLLLTASRFEEQLEQWQILVEEGKHLPANWLIGGGVSLLLGLALFWLSTRVSKPKVSDTTEDYSPSQRVLRVES